MPSSRSRLPVSQLISSEKRPGWQESVALAQSLAAICASSADGNDGARGIEQFAIDRHGDVFPTDDACPRLTVSEIALFLGQLLPPPHADRDNRAPAGLQFAIGRALGLVEAPPFESLEDFSAALARFERGDRRELLVRLFRRCAGEDPARTDTERRQSGPSATVLRRMLRDADQARFAARAGVGREGWTARRGPEAQTLRRLFREEDRERYLAMSNQAARRRFRVARTELTVATIALAGAAFAARGYLLPSAARTITLRHAAVSPQPIAAREGRTDRVTGATPGGTAHRPAPIRPVPALPDIASSLRSPSSASEHAGLSGGRLVQALDAGRQPIFSPSFASDGSAVFFDEQDSTSSRLMTARSNAGGQLHVVSVVNNGARNYHPQLSPDGRTLAFDSDRDGTRGVYLASRDGGNVRRVSGPGYAAVPTWSPDGTRLAFVRAEADRPKVWNLWCLDLRTREARRLTSYAYGQPWGASWFPDGHRICYSHEDRLVVLDLSTGRSRQYDSPRSGSLVRTPAVSPDGRRIIFQVHHDGTWLLNLETGAMTKVLEDPSAEEFAWAPDGHEVAFHSRRSGQWGIWFMTSR